MRSTKRRNNMLYIWEGIASLCVVLIHCRFPGSLGVMVETVARFSVPLFFTVSGFFWSVKEEVNDTTLKKKLKKIILIFLCSFFVYAIYKTFTGQFSVGNISMKDIVMLIVFNSVDFVCGHLWFLLSLVYSYIAFYLIEKLKLFKIMPILSVTLLVLHYVGRIISATLNMSIEGVDISYFIFYRNWLMLAVPFFWLGYYLRENRNKICNIAKKEIGLTFVILGMILSVLERIIINIGLDFYIGSIIIVVGIFIMSFYYSDTQKFVVIRYLGEKCALIVYLVHPLIMYILRDIFLKFGIINEKYISWCLPIMVLVISVIIAVVLNQISKLYERERA